MDMIFISVIVCLSVFIVWILVKYILLKRNIRNFSSELEKLKSSDYRQPVKVTDFDDDLVKLAVLVNEHVDIQRELGAGYREKEKQLGTVISGISHDFRTPLTSSLGYLQMIEKSGELMGKNREYLMTAIQKNRYLKELSDDFFEFARNENQSGDMTTEDVNLSNLMTETLLEQHSWIESRKMKTDFEVEDGIVINTDPHLLERILENLMSNASKYADGSFGVSLKKSEEHVSLKVFNGLAEGITVDTERVFEPFYRMDARTSEGSGLGLYVVKLLCERLGWKVSAEITEQNIFSLEIMMKTQTRQ